MGRYALFCCLRYYPSGGWKDFEGAYSDIDTAIARASEWEAEYFTWEHTPWESAHYHIVDLTDGVIVKDSTDD
jgi:hypothetical protein